MFCHCWGGGGVGAILSSTLFMDMYWLSRTTNSANIFSLTHVHAMLQNELTNIVFTSLGNSMGTFKLSVNC